MSSPATAPASQKRAFPFEAIAKGVTYALPFIYVCGFVVLSLFEAEFGIADLSLIRVKALAAGLLFVFFVGFPSVVSIRALQVFGLEKPGSIPVAIGSKSNLRYFYIIQVGQLYISSVFMAAAFLVFFNHGLRNWFMDTPNYQGPGNLSLLRLAAAITSVAVLFLGIGLSLTRLIAKNFAVRPRRCALLVSLISLLWLIWTFEIAERTFFSVTVWCFIVGLGSIWLQRSLRAGVPGNHQIGKLDYSWLCRC